MDFQTLEQSCDDLYDRYIALERVVYDFSDDVFVTSEDAERLTQKFFGRSFNEGILQPEVQEIAVTYFSKLGELLKERLAAQIDLYHAALLARLYVKRTSVDHTVADTLDMLGDFAFAGYRSNITDTKELLEKIPTPLEIREIVAKESEFTDEVAKKPIDVNQESQHIDNVVMHQKSCDGELKVAETGLEIVELEIAFYSMIIRHPFLKTAMAGNSTIYDVHKRTKHGVTKFFNDSETALNSAAASIEAAVTYINFGADETFTWRYGRQDKE